MKFFRSTLAILAIGALSLSLLAPVATLAAEGSDANPNPAVTATTGSDANPAGPATTTIDTPAKVIAVLQKITNWMFTIFITVAAMMIIYAAFIYLTSGGGEEVSTAHKMLLYAAVAIIVATASRGLVALTRNFITTP